jgi:RNA polymerase sigma-70 factor (sigma-E family)
VQRRAPGKRLPSVNETMAGEPAQVGAPRRADHAAAVQDLFREHWLELVRLATVMVGDVATAEDVVQDAFERLHRSWHRLREPASGLAYARSSVLNGCRSVHRRAAVARKYGPRLALPADATAPDTAAAAAEAGQVGAALQRLPRRQREVLVLRYYADLDTTEIAGTLGLTQSGVRATLSRALTSMARALEEDSDD